MGKCNRVIILVAALAVVILILRPSVDLYYRLNDALDNEENDNRFQHMKYVKTDILQHNKSIINDNLSFKSEQMKLKSTKMANHIELIRQDCGELCNTTRSGSPSKFFDEINAKINCNALFKNPLIDGTHGLKNAPEEIPEELLNYFTMNGKLRLSRWYFDQPYLEKKAHVPIWPFKQVEHFKRLARQGKLKGNYGIQETNALRDGLKHAPGIKNGRVLVIGSENPWVEACLLDNGAREIVTLEYGEIVSEHPKIKTMIPFIFRQNYLNGSLAKFDAVVSFSSVEHSGLGRYGDALNPWGDIIAVAKAWCVTKDGGSLTLGVMYDYENDAIRFNAGRWYGKIRFPYLVTNWKQYYLGTGSQRVHVFIKS